jgi:hypothetical protein
MSATTTETGFPAAGQHGDERRDDPDRLRASQLLQEAYERVLAEQHPDPPVQRHGRGSLKGALQLTGDWDSPEVDDAVAHDFGVVP